MACSDLLESILEAEDIWSAQMMGEPPEDEAGLQATQSSLRTLLDLTRTEPDQCAYREAVDDYVAFSRRLSDLADVTPLSRPTAPVEAEADWAIIKDGDPDALELFRRHYSYNPARRSNSRLFVGPGEKLILMGRDGRALFAMRRALYRSDDQAGPECVIFHNESNLLTSRLIISAEAHARRRWP